MALGNTHTQKSCYFSCYCCCCCERRWHLIDALLSLAPFSAANRTEAKGTQEESEFRSRSVCAKKRWGERGRKKPQEKKKNKCKVMMLTDFGSGPKESFVLAPPLLHSSRRSKKEVELCIYVNYFVKYSRARVLSLCVCVCVVC